MTNLFRKRVERHFAASRQAAALSAAVAKGGSGLRVTGPKGAYLSLVLNMLARGGGRPSLVVTPSEKEAESIVQDSDAFGSGRAVFLPWWGVAPYEGASPLASLFGERAHLLSRLLTGEPLMVVAPLRALLTPVPDPAYLAAQVFEVAVGSRLDPQETADHLARAGYLRVPTVTVHGEFAVRGEVIDIYVPGESQAARITLDFEEVTGIRSFDPLDQGSTGSRASVRITPSGRNVAGNRYPQSYLARGRTTCRAIKALTRA